VIRQVLLDLDGTLTDSGLGIARCIVHALERLGRPAPDPAGLRHWVGPPLADSFRTFLGAEHGHLVAPAIAAYRERFSAVGIFENQVYPGVPELLAELRERGCELRVVTSKPTIFSEQILRHFELAHHFAGIHGSELDGSQGEKAALIARVLASERIGSHAAVMIGDRSHDILGARKNGVPAIGVLWGYGSRDELQAAGAGALVSAPDEVIAALESLGGGGSS
jgi:phosphoglycolate phosphatase